MRVRIASFDVATQDSKSRFVLQFTAMTSEAKHTSPKRQRVYLRQIDALACASGLYVVELHFESDSRWREIWNRVASVFRVV